MDDKDELILKLAERLYICFEILQRMAEKKERKPDVERDSVTGSI